MKDYPGKFIVIDGTDGSGKATQTELLAEKLRYAGFDVALADFPQYGKKSAGPVEEYLNGKYGPAHEVGPYRGSIFYALDRYDASFEIKEWLKQGKIVISNRYVTANMGHQGGKIKDLEEKRRFYEWLYELEYEIFQIPKPDMNIILHVDAEVAQKLVANKSARKYIEQGDKDMHEADLEHLRNAERTYLEIVEMYPDFTLIECTREDRIMPREEINYLLWKKVMKTINGHANHPLDLHINHFNSINRHILDAAIRSGSPARETPVISDGRRVTAETATPTANRISITVEAEDEAPVESLKVQRLSPLAKFPSRAYAHDIGYDLYATGYYSIPPGKRDIVSTGIKMAIPPGFSGLIWDKSGVAKDGVHVLGGVYDPGFRGEITITMINLGEDIYNIAPGQKVAQILIQPVATPEIIETEINDQTERGQGRHGSSGLF
ncbi:hypothetical protein A2303_04420 [Candidatus Falkowbacteria bacterium RIFOXYB2_FULL_47_14]|uniref:Thymidylate kinase n=1 Tax=Candidatus Falkowbacteria bacterium RIFOXYA2_FULL_47_19 TaxID=1797994 RepID=A0A1F5SMG0_9BACT|nr:MAG: hypothetical protein A2227_02255 [Candidatus Falkowbacteria bacterium RIFOXYA2_FULL_47_19]OGF42792.1 MAG: hypothetical protein A2303_04420 [Candidatus Falkowbacteria bacterium RIFOXYB2_FULL_47_14]